VFNFYFFKLFLALKIQLNKVTLIAGGGWCKKSDYEIERYVVKQDKNKMEEKVETVLYFLFFKYLFWKQLSICNQF